MLCLGTDINKAAAQAVLSALHANRFPHAAVIEGGDSALRESLAKGIAGALVCSGEGERPCGRCPDCRKASVAAHPDIETYGENEKGVFKVDFVRDMIHSAGVIPNEADAKVFIMKTENPLSPAVQNALLKVLEEPPHYMFFLLLCPSKASLLPTILSRAQVFALGEGERDMSDTAAQAAKAACAVARAVIAPNEYEILTAAAVFEKNKELLRRALPVLEEIMVEAMKVKHGCGNRESFEGAPALLGTRLTGERLCLLQQRVQSLQFALEQNRNYNLILTRLCTLLRG